MIAWHWQTTAGVALDLAFGDPKWMPHPVRAIGWLITKQEPLWRKLPLRWGGVALCLATVGLTCACVAATIRLIPYAEVYWIYSLVAIRDLDRHAVDVMRAPDLPAARERLSWIVGRDTAGLEEPEIVRATVETVAENLNDGIVAPLFYLAIGGPVCMAAFKAISTLDSMVGYKDERYRDLGWFPARTDDWANWIPARLTALLIWIVAALPGLSMRRSIRVTLRDGASQPSPNSGYPEAAVAGALGVRLGGLNYYRGVPSRKAHLGDAVHPLDWRVFPWVRFTIFGVSLLAAIGASLR